MTVADRPNIKDVSFSFRYFRPRLLMGLSTILAIYLIWLAVHPTQFDNGHATGAIDLIFRSLPTPIRVIFCCAMAVSFLLGAQVTYWPCIRDASIVIFDGRRLHGFGFWGQKASLLRSKVETVAYRYGGASVRGGEDKIWIPLSLLDTDKQYLSSIKAILDEIID